MHRIERRMRPSVAMLITSVMVACGGDEGGRRDDTAAPPDASDVVDTSGPADTASPDTASPDTSTPDTASPDTVAPDTVVPDTAVPDTAAGDTQVRVCGAEDLAACEYPSRDLAYVERDGIATTEPETGRSLPLHVRIPVAAGPLPVVIWSHGGGFLNGGQLNSDDWGDLLARHGYVVLHVGHSPLGPAGAARLCELASVPEAECVTSAGEDDDDNNGLVAVGRSYDLAAVLDDLPRLSQFSVDNGGPALDLERVVVAGWSGGSRGPMVLMGAKVRPTPGAPLFTNPHALPVGAIFMSPAGPGFGGWYEDASDNSWNEMRGPTFTATGTNDQKPTKPELTGAIRRMPFPLQPADGTRLLLYSNLAVGVGGHGTYDLQSTGSNDPRLDRLSRAIGSVGRAFVDAAVDKDAAALAWLVSDHAKVLAGDVDWLRR